MNNVLLTIIRLYQKIFSPDQGYFRYIFPFGRTCRFTPTCSEYMYQAVELHGIITGLHLGLKRILRCHPWNPGGMDPVKLDKLV